MRYQIVSILAAVLLLFQIVFNSKSINFSSLFQYISPTPTAIISLQNQSLKVIRVVDGDTIEVEGNKKIRYIGMNTPELHDPRRPVQCFGQEAYEENKKLVEGKTVRLEKDVSEVDKYGRLLRYVYLEPASGSGQTIFINDYLTRQGFAHVSTYPPDVKYVDQLVDAQNEAQENNRGLWATCPLKQK